MQETVRNIIISLGTSAVVGFFTFAFGMKSGKNQADRAMVQRIYTELLKEFESIETCLDSQPKAWIDYPEERSQKVIAYVTPLRKIKTDGEYVYIPNGRLEKLEELEREALEYGEESLRLVESIPTVLSEHSEMYEASGVLQTGELAGRPNVFLLTRRGLRQTHQLRDIYDFLNEQKLTEALSQGIEVRFSDDRPHERVIVTIDPTLLKVPPSDFCRIITHELMTAEGGNALLERRPKLRKKLNKSVVALRKRARDPFPFWKTLGTALGDIFKL